MKYILILLFLVACNAPATLPIKPYYVNKVYRDGRIGYWDAKGDYYISHYIYGCKVKDTIK